jgi:hypothetical protein
MFSKSGSRREPFGLNNTISSGFIILSDHLTPLGEPQALIVKFYFDGNPGTG